MAAGRSGVRKYGWKLTALSLFCEWESTGPYRNRFDGDYTVLRRIRTRITGKKRTKGSIFVEYILLVTIVGIGVIVGLATIRSSLINELNDLANAINAINS